MKRIFFSLIISIAILSLPGFKTIHESKRLAVDGAKVEVVFSHQLSFDDLAKMKSDLLQKEIILNFRELSFDENNKLTSIEFYVKCGNKYSGGALKENISNESHFGFFYDKSTDAKINFKAGEL